MTVISQAATRKPYAGATALRHSHVRAIMLAALTTCLVLLGQTANAQKSYKYEDDPIRAGNKALEENRLDDAKTKFNEAITASYQLPKAKFGLAEVDARTGRLEEAEALYRESLDISKRGGEKTFAEAHAGLGI